MLHLNANGLTLFKFLWPFNANVQVTLSSEIQNGKLRLYTQRRNI